MIDNIMGAVYGKRTTKETEMMEIKLAKDLNEDARGKISELFVEAFKKDLRMISRDADTLARAFSHMFVLDYFYVGIIDNEIAGMMVCVDKYHYCINHDRKILVKHLGFIRGSLADMIFKHYFNRHPKYPVEIDDKTGSIEFVATSGKYQRMGIAAEIMEYIFSLKMYEKYILEVADTNERAVNLYRKMGYREVHRIKQRHAKSIGINYLVYMVK
jgi:ribosomal protein S18 acetylase RimI-like enzyme